MLYLVILNSLTTKIKARFKVSQIYVGITNYKLCQYTLQSVVVQCTVYILYHTTLLVQTLRPTDRYN